MKTKIPSLVTVLTLTMITSLMWISFSIYGAITSKPDPVVPKEVTELLDPNLDEGAIEKIRTRLFLSEGEIPQTQISQNPTITPSPSPIPSPQPLSTEEATPSPTPTEPGQAP